MKQIRLRSIPLIGLAFSFALLASFYFLSITNVNGGSHGQNPNPLLEFVVGLNGLAYILVVICATNIFSFKYSTFLTDFGLLISAGVAGLFAFANWIGLAFICIDACPPQLLKDIYSTIFSWRAGLYVILMVALLVLSLHHMRKSLQEMKNKRKS